MAKVKTIRLSESFINPNGKVDKYRVEQVTDSVEYPIGYMLDRTDVQSLCSSTNWKVTIVPKK